MIGKTGSATSATHSSTDLHGAVASDEALPAGAKKINARATWGDLALPAHTQAQLRELCRVSEQRGTTALFSGPSGTGKTTAAEVVAHTLGLNMYRIDLGAVVSKYIGETETNLERVFAHAANSGAVLFFDEADALFGKRSEVKDAHDRYANVEVSYLLQKLEQFNGLAILASNHRDNLDDAFRRRLSCTIDFQP